MQCLAASQCLPSVPASVARRSPPRPSSKARLQPVCASALAGAPSEDVQIVRQLKAVAAWGGASEQGQQAISRLQQLLGPDGAARAIPLAMLPSLYSPPEGSEPLGLEAVAGMAALDSLLAEWYPRACPALAAAASTAEAAAAEAAVPYRHVNPAGQAYQGPGLDNFLFRHGDATNYQRSIWR